MMYMAGEEESLLKMNILETLVSGTSEENELLWKHVENMKIEIRDLEEKLQLAVQDVVQLKEKYHDALHENRKLYNEVQDLKGAARSNKEGRYVQELREQVAFFRETIAKKDEEIERLLKAKHSECGSQQSIDDFRNQKEDSPQAENALGEKTPSQLYGLSDT